MAGRGALRASDKDRDRIADRLRSAAGEGRLMIEELEQRLGAALTARTYGELETLIADLPGPRLLKRPRRRLRLLPALGLIVAAVVIVPIVLAAIALAVQFAIGVVLVWWIWALVAWAFFGRALRRRRAYHLYRAGRWDRGYPSFGPRMWHGQWHAEWNTRRRA
jgi:hypothetical protein